MKISDVYFVISITLSDILSLRKWLFCFLNLSNKYYLTIDFIENYK